MARIMKKLKKNSTKPGDPAHSGDEYLISKQETGSLWHDPFVHVLMILATGFIVYFNSVHVPFIFDDYSCLVNNPVIKSFDCFPDTRKVFEYSIDRDLKNNLVLRPVAYFTFAANYALHGLDLFGYHLFNLLLHLGCGLLVYCFFVQLLATPVIAGENTADSIAARDRSNYLPLFTALLFICHPLQTQAVTYIIQRFVPLTTFFFLAALVLYGLYRHATTTAVRVLTYFFSLTAVVCAMESKEIAFTLPAIIVLVEIMFFRGGAVPRILALMPFILTMAIIPAKLMTLSSTATAQNAEGVSRVISLINYGGLSPWDYLMTQFGVICTYLRLLVLPVGQNLDYDYPLQKSFLSLEVLLPLILLLSILATGFFLVKRSEENRLNKIVAFGIFWFFITLSVESSIIPIEDLIFEHRAYLPSIGFFISLLTGTAIIFKRCTGKLLSHSRIATLLLVSVIVAFSTVAIARNMVWCDEVALWRDVVAKSPNKARVHIGLGLALLQQSADTPAIIERKKGVVTTDEGADKNVQGAINEFREAIRLEPKDSLGYIKLADVLTRQGKYDEALRLLVTATELQPKSGLQYVMRGELFELKNDGVRARQEYLEAVKVEPFFHVSHLKLADIYIKEGNVQDAIAELEFVMRINPDESVRMTLDRLKNR